MRYKFIFCTWLIFTLFVSFPLCGETFNLNVLPYKKKLKEKILDGEIFSESKVKSSTLIEMGLVKQIQELHFTIAGLHEKSCDYALKKLSLYENYSQFIDFVKESKYDEKNQEINFLLDHALLPYSMRLIFKLPRIEKPGAYPFTFELGILKNLHGTIYAIDHKNRCLFFTKADWEGPHTGFPDLLFELFSQTLSKLTMERLFRISNTLSH